MNVQPATPVEEASFFMSSKLSPLYPCETQTRGRTGEMLLFALRILASRWLRFAILCAAATLIGSTRRVGEAPERQLRGHQERDHRDPSGSPGYREAGKGVRGVGGATGQSRASLGWHA